VGESLALLLRGEDRVRFLPTKDAVGSGTISYRAWDRSRGAAGARADLTVPGAPGGSSPFSTATETATVAVTPVNDAPVLDTRPSPKLTSIIPGTPPGNGDLVTTLLGGATDADGNALGIAVVGVTSGGPWQVRPDGEDWAYLAAVSPTAAQLLGPLDRIRFVPNASESVSSAGLSYKAWDQTAGGPDTTIGTAFSKAVETATLTINSVDDRPVLNPLAKPALSPVRVGDGHPPGDLVSALVGPWAADADPAARLGIAVTAAPNVGGKWWVDTGTGWVELEVPVKSSVLLEGTARIRFIPDATFTGTAKLTFKAWDAGSQNPNGPLALSTASVTAVVVVNTAPVINL
jgi:hypothetical protein